MTQVGKNVEGWMGDDRVAVSPGYRCDMCFAYSDVKQEAWEIELIHKLGNVTGNEHAGAFANFLRVSIFNYMLNHLPDVVPFKMGALIEPLSVAVHDVLLSQHRFSETTMVIGTGVIG
jgi:(R,R)-butanediol dehydrogenase / meso-butanediol dehydrogenase / diacetyl reductase